MQKSGEKDILERKIGMPGPRQEKDAKFFKILQKTVAGGLQSEQVK